MDALLVAVPEFTGPLDLLLTLIQKRRLDVTAVSLAAVADQYLEQVLAFEGELDALSEFLLVASQLLLIKSRALLPASPGVESELDAADDLRRRLAEYQLLQDAAGWLGERERDGCRAWGRGSELPQDIGPGPLAPTAPEALARALAARWKHRPAPEPQGTLTRSTRPTLRARAACLLEYATEKQWRSLKALLGPDAPSAVATFLALLVLVRAGYLLARQIDRDGLPELCGVAGAPLNRLPEAEWD